MASVGVVQSMPTLDPLDVQRSYQYEIRRGDLNGDGRKDIYLRRTSGGNPNNGVINKTIITQNLMVVSTWLRIRLQDNFQCCRMAKTTIVVP